MRLTFGDAEDLGQRKQTRREVFLGQMDQVVPWKALLSLIEPHYPKSGQPGRQPYALETMLRIHLLQQWYALSDPGMEEALYDMPVMRRFASWVGWTGSRTRPRSSTSDVCWRSMIWRASCWAGSTCTCRTRDASAAAVWSHLVVVAAPLGDDAAGLDQRREPMLVEAFVAELAVEALDVAVLHKPARLDQQVLDAMLLRPCDEGPAGELRTVVRAHRPRVWRTDQPHLAAA